MLGRSIGLSDEKMRHLRDDPLPQGVYTPDEVAVIRYAQRSTRMLPIDAELYHELERHFSRAQIIELCFTVGLSNLVNRFHATFLTDVDSATLAAVGDHSPLPLPKV
jgi:alkylhydroperoxidase family enzyme